MKIIISLTILVLLCTLATETSAKKKPCVCGNIYMPVCSTNGHTYNSKCYMTCAGAYLKHNGRCY